MYLDEIVAAQKRGEARGIASVCSAHPRVIGEALKAFEHPLIEATCNQVNQFGGYTGMTPHDFVAFVRRIAQEGQFSFENMLLGGDHLGPHVWQAEAAVLAMAKAKVMVAGYAEAGFRKLHLDCSMRLADDAEGPLGSEVAAGRAAELAEVAERASRVPPSYVIGTEVPRPGGATGSEEPVQVTDVSDVSETIEAHERAFRRRGLQPAWERVIAVVVQPGVEFGDDFVVSYSPKRASGLAHYIESQPMIYEAHSTDHQTPAALKNLVCDHFAILKVGPALTYAYREAIFVLAMMESEWIPKERRSNLLQVLDETMIAQPGYWKDYYRGTVHEQEFKRKYSLSDRSRYYWARPQVQYELGKLMRNLTSGSLPHALCSQFLGETGLSAEDVISLKIRKVLQAYQSACEES